MLIHLENLTLGYEGRSIIENVDLRIEEGDYLGLVGPNGCGKTTILRAILNSIVPLNGMVHRSSDLHYIGYVPQRHGLNPFFPLSALDIVKMGRYGNVALGRGLGKEDEDICKQALDRVGLHQKADTLYRELSGGQQQRILIARALACGSKLLLLDEPTTGMDIPSEAEIMQLLDELHKERKITIVLVTHHLNLVAEHATRIAIVRNSRLYVGSADEILTDENLTKAYGIPVEVLQVRGAQIVRVKSERRS